MKKQATKVIALLTAFMLMVGLVAPSANAADIGTTETIVAFELPTAEVTEATEAAEVTEATEAAEVTEATEAAEVTEATEAAEVTEATEAAEVTEATEAAEVTEATEAAEVTEATEAAEVAEAAEAAEATEAAEMTEGAEVEAAVVTEETTEAEEAPMEELPVEEDISLEKVEALGTSDSLPETTIEYTATVVSTKADVVFVIDSTGSMYDEINNVKNNLNEFTSTLDESGVDFRISVVEYKDITEYGERDSTKILEDSEGTVWFDNAEDVANVLSTIDVTGGGDDEETVIDALGAVLNDLEFREDASKFAIVLTDADFKNNNDYGIEDMEDLIAQLKEAGINTSVITNTREQSSYEDLYTQTDGVYADINGDFSEELVKLADHIEKVTIPVRLILTTTAGDRNDAEAHYILGVQVKAMDEEKVAKNVSLTLSVPGNFVVTGSKVLNIAQVAPGKVEKVSWNVAVPVKNEDATYTWKVNANSESFATGTVVAAQDTFQVEGRGATDYTWNFNEDQFNFSNYYDAFGAEGSPFYVSDEDLQALVESLSPTDLANIANEYAKWGSTKNLLKNDLKEWKGACYGLSLTAALFKVGLLNPSDFMDASGNPAENTHDINPLTADTNTALESMINIYHFSQMTTQAQRYELEKSGGWFFSDTIETMWEKAASIGKEGSAQQPYIVRLRASHLFGENYGHAVVCYGAEEGEWDVGEIGRCTKRLLIADPNYSNGTFTHIYISEDNSKAMYFVDENYNYFGYRQASLSELNTYAYPDMVENHKLSVAANEHTNLVLTVGSSKAVIIAGKVIDIADDMPLEEYWLEDALAGGESQPGSDDCLYLLATEEDITLEPTEEGGSINTLVTMGNYSAKLDGVISSMVLGQTGDIAINGASGDFSLELAVNDSPFEFITISGQASGDVVVSVKDGVLDVSGDIQNYTVQNMNRDSSVTDLGVNGNENTRFVIEGGKVVAYVDKDGDGVYETPVNPATNSVSAVSDIRTWRLGSENGLKFTGVQTAEDLLVYVDGFMLNAEDYVAEGNTITLTPAFLNQLGAGVHKLTTNYNFVEFFQVIA